jgi:hypothetical protein
MVSAQGKSRTPGRFPDAEIIDQQDKYFRCRYLLRRWFLLAPPAGLVIFLFYSGSMRVSPCMPTLTLGCQRTLPKGISSNSMYFERKSDHAYLFASGLVDLHFDATNDTTFCCSHIFDIYKTFYISLKIKT